MNAVKDFFFHRNCLLYKCFQESLKGKLFDILDTVDSYIELETIIDQMKN